MNTALDRQNGSVRAFVNASVLAVALGSGFVFCWTPGDACAIAAVSVEPPSVSVQPADQFELQLWINSEADTISNYDIVFSFDPVILEFVEAIEGSLYSNSGFETWFEAEEESLGTWEVFDAILFAGGFVLAPGELARLRFEAVAPGLSPIQLLSVAVTDIDRIPLDPLASEGGVVTVEGATGVGMPVGDCASWRLGLPHPNPAARGATILLYPGIDPMPPSYQVVVCDGKGSLIAKLDSYQGAHGYEFFWDGRDSRGIPVSSGVYFLGLSRKDRRYARKLLILR